MNANEIIFPADSDISECGRYEVGPAGLPVLIVV